MLHSNQINEFSYKGIAIEHETLKIRIIYESKIKKDVQMEVYLDKCDETAPDKELFCTWLTIPVYISKSIKTE